MKTRDGFQQCYNGKIAVEAESGLIVAAEVVHNVADDACLVAMTEAAQAQGGEKPERVLADAGYRSEENFRKLAEKKITAYVALGREGMRGKDIVPSTKNPHTQARQGRLRSDEGRGWCRQRKWLAEPPFGLIKHVLGLPALQLAGPQESESRVANGLRVIKPEENRSPDRRLTATDKVRKRRCEEERKSIRRFWSLWTPKTLPDRFPIFSMGQTPSPHFSLSSIVPRS